MNYLVAVDGFFPDRPGGSARVAWDIAQLMRDRGHNVTIFCHKQKPQDDDYVHTEGVSVVRFQFPKTFSVDPFKVHKQITAGLKTAGKYLTSTNWDVVHVHTPLFGNIVYKLLGHGPKYICTVHSPSIPEQQANWAAQGLAGKIKWVFGKGQLKKLEWTMLKEARRIHTLSEFTKESIDRYYGVGNKVTVIPHWCREDFTREHSKPEARELLGWPKKAQILFSVRRLAPRMGLDVAIKAIAPLLEKRSDLYFVIAGAGSMEYQLKQLAQSFGVTNNVWFLGQVSDEILKRCYEAADLFVLPTRALECFGLPVLEALAYGLPVISTDAAALPELMGPILPECIVPSDSVEKLREKIQTYLEGRLNLPTPETLIKYVEEHYGPHVVVPRIVELLES